MEIISFLLPFARVNTSFLFMKHLLHQLNEFINNNPGIDKKTHRFLSGLKDQVSDYLEKGSLNEATLNYASLAIITTNAQGIIRSVNKAAEKLLGYDAGELIGKHTPLIFHDKAEIIAKAAALSEEIGKDIAPGMAVFTAKPDSKIPYHEEWKFITKSGKHIPVMLSLTAIFDELDVVVGYVGIAHDITNQKSFEASLISHSEQLKQAQVLGKFGSYEFDLKNRKATWSPFAKSILGFNKDAEIDPIEVQQKIHPDDRNDAMQRWEDAIKRLAIFSNDFRLLMPDGSIKYINGYGKIEYDAQGSPLKMVGTIQDITERKTLEENSRTAAMIIANSGSILFKWKLPERTVEFVFDNVSLLGYASHDFYSGAVNYKDLIFEEDQERVLQTTEIMFSRKNQQTLNIDYRIIAKNGSIQWVSERSTIVRDAKGTATHLEGVITNITQRKVAEQKLVESELRYELAVNGTSAGIWDWFNVHEDKQWWSPQYFELLGYTPNEIESTVSNFVQMTHPDDRDRVMDMIKKHFQDKKPYSVEFRIKTKQGPFKWFLGSGKANFDINGEPTRMAGSIIDISERKNVEEKIRLSEALLLSVLNSTDSLIFSLDADLRLTKYNHFVSRFISSLGKKIDIGVRLSELLPAWLAEKLNAGTEQVLATQEPVELFLAYSDEKNTERYYSASIHPILSRSKKIEGITVYAKDISNQKKTEEQLRLYAVDLEKINKELDQFAYIVSHDLKAPLRAIHNLSSWIEEDIKDLLSEESKKQFELLRGRVHRMESFINGILEYSRVGRKKVKTGDVDTTQLVRDIFEAMRTDDRQKLVIQSDMPTISTSKIELEQVFSNLISNAIKYNRKPDACVSVGFSTLENHYEFFVQDNGPGIEKQYQEKIFTIFQTLQPRDSYESTGVGLAIVKKVLEENNCSIRIESTENEGTTFYFTWPKS